ncbi:hypothetical protein QN277_020348 [Acacia crassicarpa]|uniref:Protein SCAR n=1 Tax=Acacia crassicarpa TaxID=499986 RepID=A0AAE1JMT3_9FABA|nr:hypothetical protein QN277_020348 [Acacia crassicarpa]
MPLVRVQVRNEYGLGRPELYKGTNKEDPKVVLDGVVVAGLVGILRQLGDLADFAAEVFHGLQEQVLTTASRSHKLMLRAQNIEASLPLLEKAILAQTSHIHFAYTAGCEWHSRAKTEQNHFIYNDLPQFIMDSYEECQNPPSLHLLDKYDPGGQGSCLRRYSDPTFFKRVSAYSDEAHIEKTEISRKTSRSKKKRSSRRNGETLQGEQMHSNGGRRTSSSQTADVVLESDVEDHSSVDSRADVGQRKSLSRRNGETFLGDQMHANDARETSSSQTADVVLESDLEDHSYSVDSRADVGQRKSFSQRNGETLQGEHMLSNGGRMLFASHVKGQTSSSETADKVLESDLEDDSYSVDSRADVGLRKSLSQRNGETLQGEQTHSNDGRMQFASHVNGQTSSSQTAVEQRKSFSCRKGETLQGEQMHSNDSRMQLASHVNGQTSSSQTANVVLESDLEDHSYSVDLRDDAGYIECVFQPSNSVQFDEQKCKESPSPRLTQKTDSLQSASPTIDYNFSHGSFDKQIASTSTGLTWDEKEEIVDSESQWCDRGEIPKVPVNLNMHEGEPFAPENSDFIHGEERNLTPASSMVQTDETDSEPDNYLDALNTIESESENDLDCETKREAEQFTSPVSSEVMGNGVGATSTELDHDFYNVFSHSMSNVSLNKETNLDFPETLQEIHPHISETHITSLRNPVQSDVPDNIEGTNILVASYDYGSPIHEPVPDIFGNSVLDCSVGLNPLDNTCSLNDTVSPCIESVPSNAPENIESERSLVDSHGSESPTHHQQELHQPASYVLDCFVHGYDSGSPIHEPVPEICGNSVLDCSVGPNPLDDTRSLIDTGSTSIKTVPSNAPVNIESIRKVDSHGSESPIHEQEPHQPANYILDCSVHGYDSGSPIHEPVPEICGNSVLDCSVGPNPLDDTHSLIDTGSTSIKTVPSNAPVNIESIRKVDSHGSESPTHQQEPHQPASYVLDCFVHGYDSGSPIHEPVPEICGNSVLDCSVGPNPLDDTRSLIDTGSTSIKTVPSNAPVNIESIRKVDSHASESPTHQQELHQPASYVLDCFVHGYDSGSPIHEPVPDIHGNSVLDCFVGPNPLDDTCSFNDTVSPSIETVPSNAPVNIESKRKVDSHGSESPTHEQDPHQPANYVFDCSDDVHILDNGTESPSIETVLSSAPVNIESKRKVDSQVSESPTHEQDPHQPANYVLDCSDDVHILDNAVSVSIEPVQSNVNVDTERTESLGDAPEYYHTGQQVPHICGNSVFDSAHNDSLSASSENAQPDGFVSSETAKNLADSHAHKSPIHEQMSHVCEISALCSEGTNSLGDYPTLNDSVSASIEIDPSDDPVDFERTINLAGSHGSVSTIHEQLPHISGNSVLNCLGGTSPLGDDHTLHNALSASIETDMSSGSKGSNLPDKEADSIDSNVCKSKEAPSELLSDPSVGLWTNGGLLGLQPSKPPDFILPSSLNQGLMTLTNDTDCVSNYNSMLKSNEFREDQDLSKIAELNQKEPRRYGQNDEDFDKNEVPAPGTVVPVAHTGFTEPIKGSGLNSPLLFGLGHKLLINSFCRKVSFDEKSGPDNSVKTGLLEQSGQNSTVQQSLPETTFKEQFSYEYPTYSPPPSPPLEHMKISFCPVDRFETFKLKLKFPDMSHHSDSTRDVFPSFWLVPEHSILLHDSGSNSDDDDTFCRSSTFVSDDCLSPHSDYNSDHWESDDTPDISGDGVYDSSHRISLIESKSSSQEVRGVTDVDVNMENEHNMLAQDSGEPSLSGHLLDFPSFDTMNPVLGKEFNNHSDYDDNLKLQGHAESIPPAPPLPPNQWWLSNQRLDMMNDKQNCMSKVIEQINYPNISESTLQLRPTPVEQNPTDHKSNDHILDKLRNKSFNKKHTETGKPNDITSPTTTDKVAAILEKANAIRQVISSDDGEDDDSWSES